MAQHEITGLGPVREDGSRFIFTRLPQPYDATAAWLAEQSKPPACGDILEFGELGAVTLVTAQQGEVDNEAAAPDAAGTEKKSDGSEDSATGSEPSPFKAYQSKPIAFSAAEIVEVGEPNSDDSVFVFFADKSEKVATSEHFGARLPVVGDYWVICTLEEHTDETVMETVMEKAYFETNFTLAAE